jgi:hypothetical protein
MLRYHAAVIAGRIALVIVIAVLALIVVLRWSFRSVLADWNWDLGDPNRIWTPEEFPNTGTLPMSTKLSGRFLRYHNPAHYHRGAAFWKTFEDGPWKWDDQQRYAGKDHNCGHYFALTEPGARAEANFYDMDFRRHRLLSARFDCAAVLDLTYEENLRKIVLHAYRDPENISSRHFFVTVLSRLTDATRGGVPLTDFLGRWAMRNGYDGILFFGARALQGNPELKSYIDHGADEQMAGPVVHGYFYDMRQDDNLKNLVVFSGAQLTSAIEVCRLGDDPPDDNPYHGASAATIDALLEFNADYQAERVGKFFYLEKPFTMGTD